MHIENKIQSRCMNLQLLICFLRRNSSEKSVPCSILGVGFAQGHKGDSLWNTYNH